MGPRLFSHVVNLAPERSHSFRRSATERVAQIHAAGSGFR